VIFSCIFFFNLFCIILVCILYRKDTNPVLKYPVFVKTLQKYYKTKTKKYFIFMHTTKSLKDKKTHHIVFLYNKKIIIYVLTCFFGFNNQFIKAMRTRQIFQKNTQKNKFSFFSFSI